MKKLLALPALLLTATLSACSTNFGSDAKPTVSLSAPATVTAAGQVSFSATASDDVKVAKVDFYVYGTLVSSDSDSPYTATYTWAATQNGTHTIKAVATDSAGQTAESTQTETVAIPTDTVKPVVTITTNAPSPVTTAGNYTLTVAASDNVAVTSLTGTLTYTPVGGTAVVTNLGSLPVAGGTVPLAVDATRNGTYVLSLVATDAAGNTGTASQSITVNIPAATTPTTPTTPTPDTEKPVVTITSPTVSTITAAGNYDVTVSATDNVGVVSLTAVLSVNGLNIPMTFSPSGGTQTIPVTALYNGTATLVVTAKDAAGNVGTATKTVTVNIQ